MKMRYAMLYSLLSTTSLQFFFQKRSLEISKLMLTNYYPIGSRHQPETEIRHHNYSEYRMEFTELLCILQSSNFVNY